MKHWHLTGALAVCLLVTAGCRTPNGLDELERELFYQEDMIYELKDYLETYKTQLNECRAENAELRRKVGGTDPSDRSGRGAAPGGDRFAPPTIEIPEGDDVQPPQIDLPDLSAHPSTPDDIHSHGLTPVANHSHKDLQFIQYIAPDERIARITLDPNGTVGYDAQEGPGGEGLSVLLEAHNADGQIVPPRGRVSIAVVDPTAPSMQQGRIARWHISPEEVADATDDQGARLQLPWPHGVPKQQRLRLYARLITEEEERLVTDHELHIGRDLVGDRPPAPDGVLAEPRAPITGRRIVDSRADHGHRTATRSPSDWRTKVQPPEPVVQRPDVMETVIVPAESNVTEASSPAVIAHPSAQPARPIRQARQRPEWSPYR